MDKNSKPVNKSFDILIQQSKTFVRFKFSLLIITGLISVIFIFIFLLGTFLPPEMKLPYYIDGISWGLYSVGGFSILSFILSVRFLNINLYRKGILELTENSMIITTKGEVVTIDYSKIFRLEIIDHPRNDKRIHKVDLITNNYVRRLFLKLPLSLIEELQDSELGGKIKLINKK